MSFFLCKYLTFDFYCLKVPFVRSWLIYIFQRHGVVYVNIQVHVYNSVTWSCSLTCMYISQRRGIVYVNIHIHVYKSEIYELFMLTYTYMYISQRYRVVYVNIHIHVYKSEI